MSIPNEVLHASIIKLSVAYTLLGAFIFTVVVTCLSLLGWVKFADPKQQSKLFTSLIVELVVICIGSFAGVLNYQPKKVQEEVQRPAVEKAAALQKQNDDLSVQLATTKGQLVASKLKPEAGKAAEKLFSVFKVRYVGDAAGIAAGAKLLARPSTVFENLNSSAFTAVGAGEWKQTDIVNLKGLGSKYGYDVKVDKNGVVTFSYKGVTPPKK
jgi:hypothetical protein